MKMEKKKQRVSITSDRTKHMKLVSFTHSNRNKTPTLSSPSFPQGKNKMTHHERQNKMKTIRQRKRVEEGTRRGTYGKKCTT
jgi:hypothetical protein